MNWSRIFWFLVAYVALTTGQLFFNSAQAAKPLRIASWNLGWHVANTQVPEWIRFCSQSFLRDSTGLWRAVANAAEGSKLGWEITEYRARLDGSDLANTPPCSVYRGKRNEAVPVTVAAYNARNQQLERLFKTNIRADVLALQEVSGIAAARDALGEDAPLYDYCSFDQRFKVQRLVIAWRKSRASAAGPCTVHEALALPNLSTQAQVRPGLSIALKIDGKVIRFLTVHLKSGCVSALNTTHKRRGHLEKELDNKDPCPTLQQQIAPLEAVMETLAVGVDGFIALGDFNRNFWHEFHATDGPVRTDNSDPTSKMASDAKTINMLREINDGQPAKSDAFLVKFACNFDSEAAQLCDFATSTALRYDEQQRLTNNKGLGCRNGVGLDHMLMSKHWSRSIVEAEKLPLGRMGNSLAANAQYPQPLLAVSDHCPIVLTLRLAP